MRFRYLSGIPVVYNNSIVQEECLPRLFDVLGGFDPSSLMAQCKTNCFGLSKIGNSLPLFRRRPRVLDLSTTPNRVLVAQVKSPIPFTSLSAN